MIGPLRSLVHDAPVGKARVKPGTITRVLALAMPYRWPLAGFLMLVVIDASIGVAIPLIYRTIINEGILAHRPIAR
jgi:ATP-binding cassette subfamily B protein